MKRWSFATVVFLLVCFVAISYSHQASAQGAGWITLFDGKSLDGWNQIGDANWRVADGALIADKGNGFLVSKNNYTDFQIRAEFWVEEDATKRAEVLKQHEIHRWLLRTGPAARR